jgi:hypothetical protein
MDDPVTMQSLAEGHPSIPYRAMATLLTDALE